MAPWRGSLTRTASAREFAQEVEGGSEEGAESSPTDRRRIRGSGGDQAEGIGGGGDPSGEGRGRKGSFKMREGRVGQYRIGRN